MTGIYKIQSPNGKVYIGQSIDIKRRFNQYKFGLKNCHQLKVKSSIEKHGLSNHLFTVEYELPDDVSNDVITKYEQFYIDQYMSAGYEMMNIKDAGSTGALSVETRNKISNALKGIPKKRRGYKISEEHRQAIIKGNLGRKMPPRTQEWYEKQRLVMTGKTSPMKGKKHTKEALLKMSASKKGQKLKPESILKREASRRENDVKFSRRNYN